MTPAWIKCVCGEYWCTIHHDHASDCACPPIDELPFDPYTEKPHEDNTHQTSHAEGEAGQPGRAVC